MLGADSLGGFGIYYTTATKGSGKTPSRGDTVMVNYVGKFMEGGVFDQSSPNEPLTFPVGMGYVIKGWDTAVMSMKKGQKGSIVSVMCDGGDRYLDTYYDPNWVRNVIGDTEKYVDELNRFNGNASLRP